MAFVKKWVIPNGTQFGRAVFDTVFDTKEEAEATYEAMLRQWRIGLRATEPNEVVYKLVPDGCRIV